MDSIFTRVSIRKYEPRHVETEKVEKLLRAAMAAPSARNQQPWEFWVVTDKDVLKALSQATPNAGPVGGATLAFVLAYRTEGLAAQAFAQIDMAIAAENMLLEANALGLGAVMIGVAPLEERMTNVAGIVRLPDGLAPFTIIAVGYPAESRKQEDRYDPARVHYIR